MDTRAIRDYLITGYDIKPLSNADFMVQVTSQFAQDMQDALVLISRESFLTTAESVDQVFALANNLLYSPRRLETYSVFASISLDRNIQQYSQYYSYLTYNEGDKVKYEGNLFVKKKNATSSLGSGWEQEGVVATQEIRLDRFTPFTAGSLTYHNLKPSVLQIGKTYLDIVLYEGKLQTQTLVADTINFTQVKLEGSNIPEGSVFINNGVEELTVINTLSNLGPNLNVLVEVTQPNSTVIIIDPSKKLLDGSTAEYLISSGPEGFIANNVLTSPDYTLAHNESAGYAPEESINSIKQFAPISLGGRGLTTLAKIINFIQNYYNLANAEQDNQYNVKYTACLPEKAFLSDEAKLNLQNNVTKNQVLGVSYSFEDPVIINAILIGSFLLTDFSSQQTLLKSQSLENLNNKLNFKQPLTNFHATNAIEESGVILSLNSEIAQVISITNGSQGSSVVYTKELAFNTVNHYIISPDSYKILRESDYADDLTITESSDHSTIRVTCKSLLYANKTIYVLLVPQNQTLAPEKYNQIVNLNVELSKKTWTYES